MEGSYSNSVSNPYHQCVIHNSECSPYPSIGMCLHKRGLVKNTFYVAIVYYEAYLILHNMLYILNVHVSVYVQTHAVVYVWICVLVNF